MQVFKIVGLSTGSLIFAFCLLVRPVYGQNASDTSFLCQRMRCGGFLSLGTAVIDNSDQDFLKLSTIEMGSQIETSITSTSKFSVVAMPSVSSYFTREVVYNGRFQGADNTRFIRLRFCMPVGVQYITGKNKGLSISMAVVPTFFDNQSTLVSDYLGSRIALGFIQPAKKSSFRAEVYVLQRNFGRYNRPYGDVVEYDQVVFGGVRLAYGF